MSVSRSRAPSTATKSARTVPSSISSGSPVLRRNASGPAVAMTPSGAGSTHGTIERVVRAQRELHLHRNPAPQALDDAHQARRAVASPRHEVDHAHRALGRLEIGLEHKCPRSVATRAGTHFAGRREKPAPMPLIAQQGREARRRSRIAGGTASPPLRHDQREPQPACRRSGRSPRYAPRHSFVPNALRTVTHFQRSWVTTRNTARAPVGCCRPSRHDALILAPRLGARRRPLPRLSAARSGRRRDAR